VLAVIATLALSVDSAFADSRSVRFEHISRAEGLSQSFVYAIAQDREGYLWFGTQEGLNRFDGYEFTVFANDPDDPSSISDESIRTVVADSDGNIWIGTDAGGLSRFDSATQSFTNYLHDPTNPASISDNRVRVIVEDSEGMLWIGTDGSGVDRFDRTTGEFTHFAPDLENPRAISGAHIWDILEDSAGDLWVATDAGLNKFDRQRGTFAHFRNDPEDASSISDDSLRALFEDSNGQFWIGTEFGGLNRLDRRNGTFEHFLHDKSDPLSISANRINTIYEDNTGVLWIGTVEGLNAWNPDSKNFDRYFQDQGNPYSLSHDNVLSIFQDRGGVLWVGTYDGLSKWSLSSRAMRHFRNDANDPGSLSNNMVTAFAEDPNGDIWVATHGGGLNLLDRDTGTFRRLQHAPDDDSSISSNRIMALHVDSDGVLWVGTRAGGLNRYDRDSNSFVRFQHDPGDESSISANGITDILEDRNKGLWIATFGGGINYFDRDTQTFRRLRSDASNPLTLSNDRVLVLLEDSQGGIWAGTYGGGLNYLEPTSGTFTQYRNEPDWPESLSGNEIYVLREDARGDLWIGAKAAGLNRWRREHRETGNVEFQKFGELEGLPSATTYSSVFGDGDALWFSTDHGLSRLNTATLEFRNYDTSHGLQGDEFNLSAGFRSSDGEIFFGGINGFNAFQPGLLGGDRLPPQVVITAFLSFNKPLDIGNSRATGQPVELKYDQDVLGFEFAALDYAAPAKSQFMYQLEGLDEDWIDAGLKRQVTYTHLPDGNYTFRVKAANNDGVWSEQDATLAFTVMPAPWNTWWAYLVYILAVVALGGILLRAHERRTQQAARLRYVDEISTIKARLDEAQRIASIGNWELDTTTNKLWWSDETYRLFQVDPESSKPTYEAFLAQVHPDDHAAVTTAVNLALTEQQPYSIDHRILREDGTERYVHERGEVTLDKHGEPVRMAGTVHDITERKKAEDNIRHRAEFQSLLASLSADLIQAPPDNIDRQLRQWIETIGTRYGLDAVSVWWPVKGERSMEVIHRWIRATEHTRERKYAEAALPWISERLLAGELVVVNDIVELPEEAVEDRRALRKRRTKSFLIMPHLMDGHIIGSCVFSTVRKPRVWSAETVAELKLIAENLVGAISRTNAVIQIRQLKDELNRENRYLRDEVRLAHGFDEIIGEDPGLRKCLQLVEKVAPTEAAVLLLGETGTGKELFARAVRKLSNRSDGPMISVNCAALPASLIESELFGHEKGAFTGAAAQRRGRFELADGGTLFLDEVGELPLELQSKLLRVLQTGEFERLGGTKTHYSDVRLVAATNRNLLGAIERGEFRSDLYYRIASFPIRLPALKDRKGDIPLLAEHFVHKHADRLGKKIDAISAKMLTKLGAYSWPGNVRELESVIERAIISAEDKPVLELPGPLGLNVTMQQPQRSLSVDTGADLSEVERAYILTVLEQTDWKISGADGAASILGIPSSTLRSKMKRLSITRHAN
jgi:transcriptional regulator with GAF, ATPase, and Fis domain/ligand-binding sensor domain-containing protein